MRGYSEPPPEINPQPNERIITQKREYELITPLYGGGAVPGKKDEVTPIRSAEIRGLLRFWWRACFGGHYNTVLEMKDKEDRIWGKAHEKNMQGPKFDETIQITIEVLNAGKTIEPFKVIPASDKISVKKKNRFKQKSKGSWEDEYDPQTKVPAYAAFALQLTSAERHQKERPEAKPVYENVSFRLSISFPASRQNDVLGALWAWETFGGIGARTRRGFGALRLNKVESIPATGDTTYKVPSQHEVMQWITSKFMEFGIDKKAPVGVPSLSRSMLREQILITHISASTSETENAKGAWKKLIDILRKFRQASQGGSSQWPEAKEIQKIDKLRGARNTPQQQRYKFPKSVLGLPIVFHFPDEGKDADLILQGVEEGRDRLASPLILRPLACKNGQAVGLAVLLENYALPPNGLKVVGKVGGEQKTLSGIIETELSQHEASQISVLMNERDVLKAFMKYLEGNR